MFINYNECSECAIKNNIKSAKDWFNYLKLNKNDNLPYHPERSYKDKGWIDWSHFLNKNKYRIKYKVDDDFFKIKSRNMFYILGLWAADGHIRGNKFSITQNKKDRYLLDNILIAMKSDYILRKHGDNNLVFDIFSNSITTDVKNIFEKYENKTKELKFPSIDNEFLPDFIRGFFDGDGCITYQKNEKCYVSSVVCASFDFLNEIINLLRINIDDFKGSMNKYKGIYVLSMGVNDTRRFGKFIYRDITNDDLYLIRKKEKFDLSGDIRIASFNKEFLSYDDAKKVISNLGIKTYRDWRRYKKENKIENIPSNVENYKEYINWKEFIK